jgi:hypothetical protein
VGRTTERCPHIARWIGYYRRQSSRHIERAIGRYVRGAAGVRAAGDYIPLIAERVRGAVAVWAATGEVTGVPEGVSTVRPEITRSEESTSAASATEKVQRKSHDGVVADTADPVAVKARLGSGHTLDSGVRGRMEAAFSRDFSRIRVHTDVKASGLCTTLSARAFAVGSDLAFAAGEYQPGTLLGDALIAHELAHSIQQGVSGSPSTPSQETEMKSASLEEEADSSALSAIVSLYGRSKAAVRDVAKNAMPRLRSGLSIQRCTCEPANYPLPKGLLPLELPKFDCVSPQALTLGEVRTLCKGGALGCTKPAAVAFGVKTQGKVGGSCEAVLSKVPAFGLAKFAYVKANTYGLGAHERGVGPCKGKTLVSKVEITDKMAEKLREGEIEHCTDTRRAFALTWGKYAKAIKELEGGYCAENNDCSPVLKRHFKERTGIDYDKRMDVAKCLYNKTDIRESESLGGLGWHDVILKNPVYRDKCKIALYKPDYRQMTDIGTHSSEDLVKGCGEP